MIYAEDVPDESIRQRGTNLLDEIKTQDPVEKGGRLLQSGGMKRGRWLAVQLGCGCCLKQPLSLAPEDRCRGDSSSHVRFRV